MGVERNNSVLERSNGKGEPAFLLEKEIQSSQDPLLKNERRVVLDSIGLTNSQLQMPPHLLSPPIKLLPHSDGIAGMK